MSFIANNQKYNTYIDSQRKLTHLSNVTTVLFLRQKKGAVPPIKENST